MATRITSSGSTAMQTSSLKKIPLSKGTISGLRIRLNQNSRTCPKVWKWSRGIFFHWGVHPMTEPDVLLMDGDCGLCTRSAVFLHPRLHDPQSLRFVAIESEEGESIIAAFPERLRRADSVYLVRGGRPYMRSAAAVRCLLYLKWHYRVLFPFAWLVPLPLRDVVYRIVARYRLKFFTQPEVCIFPSLTA